MFVPISDAAFAERLQASCSAWLIGDAGLSAKDLAEHLMSVSMGIKHRVPTAAEYRAQIRVAVKIVCGGKAG